jgi:hypothetical protein
MAQNTLQPLEDATCSQLMKLLSLIEKALFSAAGMKTLCKPLQRNPAKPSLLEMVEFCTNRGRRSLVNLNELEDEGKRMADMNVHHGRRAMFISMPPDWKNEGIYSIVTLSGGSIVKIVQRCSNGQRVVPADILEGHDAKHLYIADNFSEEEASFSAASRSSRAEHPAPSLIIQAAPADAQQFCPYCRLELSEVDGTERCADCGLVAHSQCTVGCFACNQSICLWCNHWHDHGIPGWMAD